jgi:hypothetical protein
MLGGMPDRAAPAYLRDKDRDPRRLWALALVLLVVVPIVAGAFYYEPLEPGTSGQCPEGSETQTDADGIERICLVDYASGTEVTYTSLVNAGPFAVQVTDVPFTGDGVLELVRAEVDGQQLPAAISAGEERTLTVVSRMLPCGRQVTDRLYTYERLPVVQRFGPIGREVRVPLSVPLSIAVGDC